MLRWILLLGGVVGAPSAHLVPTVRVGEPAVVFEENPWGHGDPILFLVLNLHMPSYTDSACQSSFGCYRCFCHADVCFPATEAIVIIIILIIFMSSGCATAKV